MLDLDDNAIERLQAEGVIACAPVPAVNKLGAS